MRAAIALATLLPILLSGCAARAPVDAAATPPAARIRFAVFANETLSASLAASHFQSGAADYENSIFFRRDPPVGGLDTLGLGMPRAPESRGVLFREVAFPAGLPRRFSFDVELKGTPLVEALNTCPVEFSYAFVPGKDYEVDYHSVGGALHRAKCEVVVSELTSGGTYELARFLPHDLTASLAPDEWRALALASR